MQVDSSQPSTAYIRQFLVEAFSDDEFSDLCFDYFRDVSESFSSGMTKRQKVQLLIEHCERRNVISNLLAAIQRILPEQYKEHFARVPQVRPEPLRLERDPRRQEIMVGPHGAPSLPPTWNIPHRRNPNFTGRADLLEAIEKALASGQRAALTQVIAGLGGVGKTQLAVEYAYRHMAEYQRVWWLRGAQPATLASDYARLAAPLNLAEKDAADQRDIVRAVQSWLGRNPGWLLIFDNAPDAASIREVLPQGECGHVLVTSRDPNWLGTAPVVSVQVMARAESVEFLCKRTEQAEGPAAGELAKELGDLPLALEQAGAYIEATSQSFAGYLELFRVHRQALLERGKPTTDYPDTVATTWLISFEAAKATPGAADVLSLFAHFAPDDIPMEMVQTSEVFKDFGSLERDDALAALRRYSLIEMRGETVSVHRLVQAVARDQLSDDARQRWAEAAVKIVDDAFPSGENNPSDVRTWPACARLLPHALATTEHAEAMQVAPQTTGRLLNQVGVYLWGRAEFPQAKIALEQALRLDETAYGPDHPNVAIRVNNLGSVLRGIGDLAGARAHFERALRVDEAVYGPDHPNVARDVNNLGLVLKDMGDLAGARAHFERALRIDEAAYGPDHPEVATDVNNLGLILKDMGDLTGARAHYERALRIDEAAFGPDHPKVAICVNNLGLVLKDMGDLAGAGAALERALRIDEAAFGPDHPDVARDVNNLGTVLQAMGDLAGARAQLERALRIRRQFLGEDHPSTVVVRNNLAALDKQARA